MRNSCLKAGAVVFTTDRSNNIIEAYMLLEETRFGFPKGKTGKDRVWGVESCRPVQFAVIDVENGHSKTVVATMIIWPNDQLIIDGVPVSSMEYFGE